MCRAGTTANGVYKLNFEKKKLKKIIIISGNSVIITSVTPVPTVSDFGSKPNVQGEWGSGGNTSLKNKRGLENNNRILKYGKSAVPELVLPKRRD